MKSFLATQRAADEAFVNKAGQADLYYTSFGWVLAYILGFPLDRKKMLHYLDGLDPTALDVVHTAAYLRCRTLLRAFKVPSWTAALWRFAQPLKERLARRDFTSADYPHHDPHSPYAQFIRLMLREDLGEETESSARATISSLEKYHTPIGGFSNEKGFPTPSVNATAAALAVQGQLMGYWPNETVDHLWRTQEETGGFRADPQAPLPDLLSTATALFVLKCYHRSPRVSPQSFVEAHWLDSGGFGATLWDQESDTEYLFYGLLALGS